jgi:hypothetical protein
VKFLTGYVTSAAATVFTEPPVNPAMEHLRA